MLLLKYIRFLIHKTLVKLIELKLINSILLHVGNPLPKQNIPPPPDEPVLVVLPQTPTKVQESIQPADADPLALPITESSMAVINLVGDDDATKQARKQKRKDKHRNKHNLSSDTEKSPNKEHKRKRKKKIHDYDAENPISSTGASGGIPKIKIKFKTLPLPGEVTPEAQFFYVSADMVRSAEEASRPTSVETVEDATNPTASAIDITSPVKVATTTPTAAAAKVIAPPTTRKSSPRKANQRNSLIGRTKTNITPQNHQQHRQFNCCVCHMQGTATGVVTCDECRKNYHFTCLDPPLKKTPKIRGYSWHCADCDPTDEEPHL